MQAESPRSEEVVFAKSDRSCDRMVSPAMEVSREADSAAPDLVAVSGARVDGTGRSIAAHIETSRILDK